MHSAVNYVTKPWFWHKPSYCSQNSPVYQVCIIPQLKVVPDNIICGWVLIEIEHKIVSTYYIGSTYKNISKHMLFIMTDNVSRQWLAQW